MTLKEWLKVNREFYNGDLLVELLKNNSYKRDDIICKLYLHIDDAIDIFGDYELKKFMCGCIEGSDHYTLKVLLWKT